MSRLLHRTPTRPAPPPRPLPGDVRLMNAVSSTVFVLAGAGLAAAGVVWLMRSPLFPITRIELEGDLVRNSVPTLRANAVPLVTGNFFSLNLDSSRHAFENVPWVRHASVRRIWPDRLAVRLEEHQPAALWRSEEGAERLVNTQGEVFDADLGAIDDDSLPLLSGPEGSAAVMLALVRRLQPVLQPLDASVQELHLSGRGSWSVELDNGATIELGRGADDELLARVDRFVRTLAQATGRWQAPLEYADLRHNNAYAVRLRGIDPTSPAVVAVAKSN